MPAGRAPRDRPRRRVRPLAATAHPRRARRPPADTTAASRPWRTSPPGSRRPRRRRSPPWATASTTGGRRTEHGGRGLSPDRLVVQGAHPGRRHLPGRPVPARVVRRAGRRVPDLPAPPRLEPRALHVLPPDARHGARRFVARAARPRRGTAVSARPIAGHPAPGRDGGARPVARARAPRRSRRSRRSTRCSWTSHATTWAASACPAASARPS